MIVGLVELNRMPSTMMNVAHFHDLQFRNLTRLCLYNKFAR